MRIVAIAVNLILNKPRLLRIKGHLLKNAEYLEALQLKHRGFNYFSPLETAECRIYSTTQGYFAPQYIFSKPRL
jgi:hypothetical protein